jgi:DNA-3-methyladenine glycosylase
MSALRNAAARLTGLSSSEETNSSAKGRLRATEAESNRLTKPASLHAAPPAAIRRLHRDELPHATVALTRFLIGKVVVHDLPEGRLSGRIVEAEAYPPGDPAGHHFRGPTPRIRSMYMAPGHAYVFFNYGNHFMLNVASEREGTAGGILIRAIEPLEGIERMRTNRGTAQLLDLTRGPGRLAAALQITREHDGIDLTTSKTLWLGEVVSRMGEDRSAHRAADIGKAVRIGITRAADRLLRFYERGNPFVSGPKRLLAGVTEGRAVWKRERKKRRAPR